jgi:hypothetical protein
MYGNGMSAEVLRWMEKLLARKTANPPPAIEVADCFCRRKKIGRAFVVGQKHDNWGTLNI